MMEVESILSNEQKNDSSAESIKYYWTTLREMQMDKESTTLSSTFSADGNYVVCGTNFGFINIWNVDNLWVLFLYCVSDSIVVKKYFWKSLPCSFL